MDGGFPLPILKSKRRLPVLSTESHVGSTSLDNEDVDDFSCRNRHGIIVPVVPDTQARKVAHGLRAFTVGSRNCPSDSPDSVISFVRGCPDNFSRRSTFLHQISLYISYCIYSMMLQEEDTSQPILKSPRGASGLDSEGHYEEQQEGSQSTEDTDCRRRHSASAVARPPLDIHVLIQT